MEELLITRHLSKLMEELLVTTQLSKLTEELSKLTEDVYQKLFQRSKYY